MCSVEITLAPPKRADFEIVVDLFKIVVDKVADADETIDVLLG